MIHHLEHEPVLGEARSLLLDANIRLVQKSEFDASDFDEFSRSMIALLGGAYDSNRTLVTPYFKDEERDKALNFTDDHGSKKLWIRPGWFMLPLAEREAFQKGLTEPYAREEVEIYSSGLTRAAYINFPSGYKPLEYASYLIPLPLRPHTNSQISSGPLTGPYAQALAQRILTSFVSMG